MSNAAVIKQGSSAFYTIWMGQLISQLGSGLTSFALSIWVFEKTGSVTNLSLMLLCRFLPTTLFSTVAGVIVDRCNRRSVMIVTAICSSLLVLSLSLLFRAGVNEIWIMYLFVFLSGSLDTFQNLAYQTSVSMLMPKKNYGRANGLMSLADTSPYVIAPFAASALLAPLGISGIILLDLATFVVAIATLLRVQIPQPSKKTEQKKQNFREQVMFGVRYIWEQPGMMGLLSIISLTNMLIGFSMVGTAMVMARTGNDAGILATVNSLSGLGGFVGGLLSSIWQGPSKKVYTLLVATMISGLLGRFVVGVGDSVIWWIVGLFVGNAANVIGGTAFLVIWQVKVAPELQGRVFAVRRLFGSACLPIGVLVGGYGADHWFEPAMMPGGSLANSFGWLVGTGPGAGMGLMFVISGLLGVVIGIIGYLSLSVRNVEINIPDHQAM